MTIANWATQPYNVIQSLLFNNPRRVIQYQVRDESGQWRDRAETSAPARRLFETEAPPERTCLRTIQFVHHMLLPPNARHVAELHIHPDAEELAVITSGTGMAFIDGEQMAVEEGDVIYIPPSAEHEIRNDGEGLLGVLFINVPTGDGLRKLAEAEEKKE